MAHFHFCCPMVALLASGCTGWEDWQLLERGDPIVQRHTLKDLRDQHVIKQRQDFSCGSAALATLLTYYFGDPVGEEEILQQLLGPLSEEDRVKKAQRGFSLLDLKRVAMSKGYAAAGFRLTASQLAKLRAPVMIFIEPRGYKHFAVYRGMDRGRVYLADPARGNLRMSLDRFLDEWSGVVFVLGKRGEEKLSGHPLAIPTQNEVRPEVLRMNAYLDLGMMTPMLPLR